MREHDALIKKNDSAYPDYFKPWPDLIQKEYDDVLEYFYPPNHGEFLEAKRKGFSLRQFFYSADIGIRT